MKKSIIKILLAGMIISLGYSCSKKIDEAYLNPNADLREPPEKLLPYIVSSLFGNGNAHGQANDARYLGAYIQSWFWVGVNSNYDRMGYTLSAGDVGQSMWRSHYYDIGQNNMKMIEWSIEEKKWDYAGAGKAIFAWSWLTLTDIYGDAILDDAFNTTLYTFRYNTQAEIYEHVRNLCFEALGYLNNTGDNAGQLSAGDAFFYNGDVNKWKKFVYGILARYHNHQSNKGGYKPDSVIYYCDRSITNNIDNASVKYAASGVNATYNYFSPQRNNFTSSTNTDPANPVSIRQSAFIANLMTGLNSTFPAIIDPRAIYLLRLNTNSTFKGLTLAKGQQDLTVLSANDRPENFLGISQQAGINSGAGSDNVCRYIFRNASPTPILTASEIQFMKAEAAYRKGDKNMALAAYREAIRLNFDMLMDVYSSNVTALSVLTPAVRDAYLANTNIVPASSVNLRLQQIMLQKYIALYAHGVVETWVDMRRFHYTDTDPTPGGLAGVQVYTDFTPPSTAAGNLFTPDNGGKLVYRVRPRFNSEYLWNLNEIRRIGADQIDYHTRRMWFSEP